LRIKPLPKKFVARTPPALIPPPMMKWSSVTSDFAVDVVTESFASYEYVVVEPVVDEDDVEVLGVLGFPFVAEEPPSVPLFEFESDDELFVVEVVVVVVPVEPVDDGFFFTTVDCANIIPTESRTMQITDNNFLIHLRRLLITKKLIFVLLFNARSLFMH
jgi:hypothetical protein